MPLIDWKTRHALALRLPTASEAPLVKLLDGLAQYAEQYGDTYGGGKLADDGVLGDAWQDMAKGFRTLLNGELFRLDGGELDRAICEAAERAGFDQNDL